MEINDLSYSVIGIALKVHSKLGPGLLESAYKEMLFYNLTQAGFNVQREMAVINQRRRKTQMWVQAGSTCGRSTCR